MVFNLFLKYNASSKIYFKKLILKIKDIYHNPLRATKLEMKTIVNRIDKRNQQPKKIAHIEDIGKETI